MRHIPEVACPLAVALLAALLAAPAAGAGERDSAMKDAPGIEIVDASFKAVVSPEAKVRRIAEGLKFTEGPVWDKAGKRLLFSDIPADTIYRW
ncbi:MAG: SMP-30/gluconolactonase/LRE family protein, partial [Planctomycetes bacterium]|nr:SMP-30/gluconolactonase/LRE family protein [Planctomycetota bacterium]